MADTYIPLNLLRFAAKMRPHAVGWAVCIDGKALLAGSVRRHKRQAMVFMRRFITGNVLDYMRSNPQVPKDEVTMVKVELRRRLQPRRVGYYLMPER